MKHINTLGIALAACLSASAQVITMDLTQFNAVGSSAYFTSNEAFWEGMTGQLLVVKTIGPSDFSGPITTTRFRDPLGVVVKTVNFYSVEMNIANILDPNGYRVEYITAAYPEGEVGFRIGKDVVVPEPSTYAMLSGLGLCAFAVWRRRGV